MHQLLTQSSVNNPLWQSSRWKASETHFQQTYVNGFWFWIESYIREFRESNIYDIFTFLPCSYPLLCGLSLSHLLTSDPLLVPQESRNVDVHPEGSVMDIHRVLLVVINIRLYECGHDQVKLRKKRWNNKDFFIENTKCKYVNRKLKKGW
jgi:3',5'-cyclic AMP phosphodiesterase CpdA